MKIGDQLDIGVVNGPVGKGTVEQIEKEEITLTSEWGAEPPPLPPVTLAIALSRPQTMRKVLFEATTLGVCRILVFPADRSDPAYARSRLWETGQWRDYLLRAAEQAFDTRIPELELLENLDSCMAQLSGVEYKLFLDVYAGDESKFKITNSGTSCLAIGPERGWTRTEQAKFKANGFQAFHLGNRILRVETATVVALGYIHLNQ